MGIYMSGLSHTKGNYQKELADMYHIYAMDPRYHKKIETDFSDRMKESLDQNGDPFRFQTGSTKISDILDLSAQKGEVLKYQIRQQIQYEASGDILKNLTTKSLTSMDFGSDIFIFTISISIYFLFYYNLHIYYTRKEFYYFHFIIFMYSLLLFIIY